MIIPENPWQKGEAPCFLEKLNVPGGAGDHQSCPESLVL